MRRTAPFEGRQLIARSEITSECEHGNVLRDFQCKVGGMYQADTTSNAANDGPCNLLGRYSLKCGPRNILDMPASDLRHLTALLHGCYGQISPGLIADLDGALTGKIVFTAAVPFGRIHERARIDGRQEKIVFRTRVGPPTDLGAAADSVTGEFQITGTADDAFDDSFWLEPDFRTVEIPLNVSDRNAHTIKFGSDELVFGIMIRAQDTSLLLSDPNLAKPDWLIRKVSMERQKSRRSREVILPPTGWSFLKQAQTYQFGISADSGQIHNGIGVYWLDDLATSRTEAAFFQANDQLSVFIDTQSTIEEEFLATGSPTIEAGVDKAHVTLISFRPRGRAYEAHPARALAEAGFLVY